MRVYVLQGQERMLMAVPKKGRLYEKCLKLLEGAHTLPATPTPNITLASFRPLHPIQPHFLPAHRLRHVPPPGCSPGHRPVQDHPCHGEHPSVRSWMIAARLLTQFRFLLVQLVFLPASDIASYVALGNVDLGITGQDIVRENGQLHPQRAPNPHSAQHRARFEISAMPCSC